MVQTTHIVPVGFTASVLADSIRTKPFSKIILVVGDNKGDAEDERSRKSADELLKKLGDIESEILSVPQMDVYAAANKISQKIIEEKNTGSEVLVNLSGSLRTIGIAAYAAATLCRVESYIGMPTYENKKVVGAKGVVDVPPLPVKALFEDKKRILEHIGGDGKGMSDLIESINPGLSKDSPRYNSERSRLSHHIKDLKEDKLVESEKKGKEITLRLTELGRIYSRCLQT